MLDNNRFLITGANGGIGSAISDVFLKNNSKVVLIYHNNNDQIKKLQEKYSNSNQLIEIHKINLLDDKEIHNRITEIIRNDPIDGYIHCPTLPIQNKPIVELTWKDFQDNIDIQTRSFFEIMKLLIPIMKERKKGKIVNILSEYTVGRPPNRIADYIVSKYSLLGLSKSLAVELGPHGINVNCISPTMTNTPLIKKLPKKLIEITASQIPLRKLAEPEDIALTALFLCSKNSDHITGENILVSGGNTFH